MSWVWGLLLALGIVLLLVLILPVHLELHYKRENKDDRLHLGVRALFGLVKLGYDIPIVSIMERTGAIGFKKDPAEAMPDGQRGWVTLTVEKIQEILRTIRKIVRRISKFRIAIHKFTKVYHVESLKWRTKFGTGDAANTAMITGLAWGFKGVLGAYIYRYFSVEKRLQYDVQPHFQAQGFYTELSCIIRFRPGKAIVATLRLVLLWMREAKVWRSIRFRA